MGIVQISGMMGQWIGMVVIVIGIGMEIKYKAHIGFIFVTAGSLAFAIATKLVGF